MMSAISGSGISVNGLLSGLRSGGPERPQSKPEVDKAQESGAASPGKSELTEEERQQVEELKQRDAEVRRHEQAHKAAAGGHARGGPTYSYQTGPDGRQYAVGGEVQIDTAPVKGDPDATIRKMRQVQRAANAPAEPSGQDRKVAAQAAQQLQAAQREKAAERNEEAKAAEGSGGSAESQGADAAQSIGSHTSGSEAAGKHASNDAAAKLIQGLQSHKGAHPGRFIDVAA